MRSRGLTYLVARVSLGDKRTPRYANRSLTFFISIFDLCGVVWCVLLVMHSFFFLLLLPQFVCRYEQKTRICKAQK